MRTAQALHLPPDEVHIHTLACDPTDEIAHWVELLSPEEMSRYSRFVFEKDRRLFLQAHATTRRVLAGYLDCDPRELKFDLNAYGKPRLRHSGGIGFNLSHTHGMVALAVAREEDIGVDVENSHRSGSWANLVTHVFTPEEQADLERCDPAQQQQRFYELWTLKEAYIKARGMGLSLPLQGFSIRIAPDQPIRIAFGEAIADDPAAWQLALFPMGTFRLAMAVRASKPWTVRLLSV